MTEPTTTPPQKERGPRSRALLVVGLACALAAAAAAPALLRWEASRGAGAAREGSGGAVGGEAGTNADGAPRGGRAPGRGGAPGGVRGAGLVAAPEREGPALRPEAPTAGATRAAPPPSARAATETAGVASAPAPGAALAGAGGSAAAGAGPARGARAAIAGVVSDAATGLPVASARVEARYGRSATETAADGSFTLEGLAADAATTVTVAHPRYRGWTSPALLLEGGRPAAPLIVELEPLPGLAVLEISCVDDARAAVGGASVRIGGAADAGSPRTVHVTDAQGRARVEVAAGAYEVRAMARRAPGLPELAPSAAGRITVADGERRELELAMPRMARLRGQVSGAQGEVKLVVRAVGDADVLGFSSYPDVDAAGAFEHEMIPGTYDACVACGAGSSAWQRLVFEPGAEVAARFAVERGPVVVRGQVRSALDGRPLEGAQVWPEGAPAPTKGSPDVARSDALGRFELRGEAPPERIVVDAAGHVLRRVAVPPGAAPAEVTVDLSPAGALRVRVVSPRGVPVRSLRVAIGGPGGTTLLSTDERGECALDGRVPGAYEVRLSSMIAPVAATLEVRAGAEAETTVVFDEQ